MLSGKSPARSRRSRRSSSSSSRGTPVLISPAIARLVTIGVVVLSIGYVARATLATHYGLTIYEEVGLGMSEDEARYVMGAPASIEQEGGRTVWRYASGDQRREVAFENGYVVSTTCEDRTVAEYGCPSAFGVRLATNEHDVKARLGAPTREAYIGNQKAMLYDDLGIRYDLARLSVQRIHFEPEPARTSLLPRLIRILVP